MVWQKGTSGNPAGRPPAGESFAGALREKLTPTMRAKLADKVIELAESGDLRALVFIRDTLDGRPAQAIQHSGSEDKPILVVSAPCPTCKAARPDSPMRQVRRPD